MENEQDSGWVYCLYDPLNNLTKVGRTQNLEKRLNNWRLVHATHLIFIGAWKVTNYKIIEKSLHRAFKDYKFNVEWFVVNPALVINTIYAINERMEIIIETRAPELIDALIDITKAEIQRRKIKLSQKGITPIICFKDQKNEGHQHININKVLKEVTRKSLKFFSQLELKE